MNHTYLRGDMYYADLGHGIGSEQEGYRPVVIIQNNVGNKHSPTVIIASITSKKDAKPKLPTHYYIDAENGLELPSIVLLEQLRTVDKRRLGTLSVTCPKAYTRYQSRSGSQYRSDRERTEKVDSLSLQRLCRQFLRYGRLFFTQD